MKRKVCLVISVITAAVVFADIAYMIKDSFFYSLNNLPTGTFIRTEVNNELFFSEGYSLDIYQVERTRRHPSGVRAELHNELTGERRTIYWQTGTESTLISWDETNSQAVTINGVYIDFSEWTYDCRDYVDHVFKPASTH